MTSSNLNHMNHIAAGSKMLDGPADALHPRCPSSTWRPADADSNGKFFMRITQVHHVFLWFCGFALHFNFGLKEVDIVLCKSESIVCETILANSKNAEPTMPTRTERQLEATERKRQLRDKGQILALG